MKIFVVLGLLVTLACAAPPMGMPPMLMSMNPMMMRGMIPPGALDMLKNVNQEDIKEALKNMPPEVKDMIKGMGISQEQIDEAVNNLPDDLTPMLDEVKAKLEMMDTGSDEEVVDPENLKDSAMAALKTQMQEMGVEIKDDEDIGSVMDKAKTALSEQLKENGFDLNDPEGMNAKIMAEMRKVTNAKPDESDDEVKLKVAKDLLTKMKEDGMDVDPENPIESINKMKTSLLSELKGMDIDISDDDLTLNNIPEMTKKIIMSGKFGPPMHVMMSAMTSITGGPIAQEVPMMMQRPMPPRGFAMGPSSQYVHGAEDALWHVFGGEDAVMQNVMEVREGLMRGSLNENALHEVMKDLLHYRLESRVLIAQNRMLEDRLAAAEMTSRPPFRSFGMSRTLGCRNNHF